MSIPNFPVEECQNTIETGIFKQHNKKVYLGVQSDA